MRIFFFAVVLMTVALSGLFSRPALAAEKEEELLKAMEAIVQQYKADEAHQQQSTEAAPTVEKNEQQLKTTQEVPRPPLSAPTFLVSQDAAQAVKDDIITTLEEAMRQYRANDFAGAISNLDYAAQLIRQKKSERMKALLPEPLVGWQAKPASAKSLGAAVFGGGSTVSRDYFTGNAAISVEIVSDSPVLQSIIMMLNNPLFAGASGGNIQTVKQQRAMFKYNEQDHSGEINIVVAGRFIVTVKGRAIDQATLLRYAEAVDFEALAKN